MSAIGEVLAQLPLSVDEIAARSELPQARVIALLAGDQPTAGDLRALARGLRLPLRAFSTQGHWKAYSDASLRFRTTGDSRADVLDVARQAAADLAEAASTVLPRQLAPPPWLRDMMPPSGSLADAEALAAKFRSYLYPDNPIGPALDLAERLDREESILVGQLRNSRYEGASFEFDQYQYILVSPRFPGRMLFSLAHECGHVLSGHLTQEAKFETSGQISRASKPEERFVDQFASCFLLPSVGVGRALNQIREMLKVESDQIGDVEIIYLSRFYGVSFDVAALRCERLELLPRGGAVSLASFLRKEFGNAERRAEAVGAPPRPPIHIPLVSKKILRSSFQAVSEGIASITWISEKLRVSIQELHRLHADLENNDHGRA